MEFTYSISIAHYNSPHLLKRMLESIPNRDDIQVIVVDDGSEEQNVAELKKLQHRNLELVLLEKNIGCASARNEALAYAKGKWLIAVDCDDMFAKGAFDVLDRYQNKDVDYISFLVSCRSPDNLTPNGKYEVADTSVRKYLKRPNSRNLKLFKFMNTDTWNKMVSLKFIRDNNIHWEEGCRVNVDVLYSYLINLNTNKFIIIPKELYWFVGAKNSITRKERTIQREFEFYLAAQKRNGFFKKINYGYPFVRYDWMYLIHFLIKRGIKDTITIIKHRSIHFADVEKARKKFVYLADEYKNKELFDVKV